MKSENECHLCVADTFSVPFQSRCSRKPRELALGRPRIADEIQQRILEMANDNPRWGYTRIRGALSNLGFIVGRNTIKRILAENGIDPAGRRSMSWKTFLKAHWGAIAATDFFTIEAITWSRDQGI